MSHFILLGVAQHILVPLLPSEIKLLIVLVKIGSFYVDVSLVLVNGLFRFFRGVVAVEHEVKLFHVAFDDRINGERGIVIPVI